MVRTFLMAGLHAHACELDERGWVCALLVPSRGATPLALSALAIIQVHSTTVNAAALPTLPRRSARQRLGRVAAPLALGGHRQVVDGLEQPRVA